MWLTKDERKLLRSYYLKIIGEKGLDFFEGGDIITNHSSGKIRQ